MQSDRLTMRRFQMEDLEEFKELIRDKMRSKYAAYDDQYPTDEEGLSGVLNYFAQSDEYFAVVLKETDRLIGFVALNCVDEVTRNVGFCIHSSCQGHGYAYEAVRTVIDYAQDELAVKKLVSGTAVDNAPSVRLLDKLQFVETGRSIGCFVNDRHGKPVDFIAGSYELEL